MSRHSVAMGPFRTRWVWPDLTLPDHAPRACFDARRHGR